MTERTTAGHPARQDTPEISPLPWDWEADDASQLALNDADGHWVFTCTRCTACQAHDDVDCRWPKNVNADFLLRAVNNHHALVMALEAFVVAAGWCGVPAIAPWRSPFAAELDQARAVLAVVKGGQR